MPQYNPSWSDMSDFVVHFTKALDQRSPYDNAMGILSSGCIEARGVFGMSRHAPDTERRQAVCFSEIPLHLLSRLADRRGPYGLGFRKMLVVERGGGPIFYAPFGSPHQNALRAMMRRAQFPAQGIEDPFWRVAPFFDSPGDHQTGSYKYKFEWEREWRHVGHFPFQPNDVAFLVIPEELHAQARVFFEVAQEDNTGPAYFCPYIDPYWSEERVSEAMSAQSA